MLTRRTNPPIFFGPMMMIPEIPTTWRTTNSLSVQSEGRLIIRRDPKGQDVRGDVRTRSVPCASWIASRIGPVAISYRPSLGLANVESGKRGRPKRAWSRCRWMLLGDAVSPRESPNRLDVTVLSSFSADEKSNNRHRRRETKGGS